MNEKVKNRDKSLYPKYLEKYQNLAQSYDRQPYIKSIVLATGTLLSVTTANSSIARNT